jgi:glycosyltransferase involved in cell wall biosynthesis
MSPPPRISVCIPTFQRATQLRTALGSVLVQTRPDFEIVVYDDASSDETPQVVASVADARVRYFRQPRNVGISANRNSCLAVARGEYLAWLDADDVYEPDMLAVQSAVLERNPTVGLVHGAHHVIGADGRRLPDWEQPFSEDTVERGADAFRELVLSNYVAAPTVMVRRACYEQLGGYADELSRSGEDWEMWLRVALRYDIAYTATPLAFYRYHGASSSAATMATDERMRLDAAAVRRVLEREHDAIEDRERVERRAHAALAIKALLHSGNMFTLGRRRDAAAAALFAFRLSSAARTTRHAPLLLASIARSDELGNYRHSKALLRRLYALVEDSFFARKIRKLAVPDPEWERTLTEIASTVRASVPRGKRIAVADKHDPTLLRLSGRRGWHFPDLRLLPSGYPEDSERAVQHLDVLRGRGADYIVFPSAAFWWLDHYDGLRRHLETDHHRVVADERCVIYELS